MSLYLEHFGLREPPFGITPDTSFAFSCSAHQEALNTLLGGRLAMTCMLFPADDDNKKDDDQDDSDQPDQDDRKESIHRAGLH